MTPYFQKATQLVQQLESVGYSVGVFGEADFPNLFEAHKPLADGKHAVCAGWADGQELRVSTFTSEAVTVLPGFGLDWHELYDSKTTVEQRGTSEQAAEAALAL